MDPSKRPASLRDQEGSWLLLVAGLLGAGTAALGLSFRDRAPRYSGDEGVWADVAHVPSWGEAWSGLRPPLVPLLYEALHHDPLLIVRAQLIVSVFAIGAFAAAASAFLRERRLRAAAGALVFFWGALDLNDFSWSVRSESFSHSLLWLTLAGFLWLLRLELQGAPRRFGAALGLLLGAALFSLTRDNAAYVIGGLGVALPLLLFFGKVRLRERRGAWGVALSLILLGVCAARATEQSGRHVAPLANLLVARLAPSPERLDYLERAHGLPDRARITRVSRKGLHEARRVVLRSAEFQAVREWLEERGPRAYRGLLVREPVAALAAAAPWFPRLAAEDYRKTYLAEPAPAWSRAREWAWRVSPQRAFPWATAALAGLGVALIARRGRAPSLRSLGGFSGLLLALAFGVTFLAYHGDAMEIERHGALVGVLLRALVAVGLVLGLLAWSERKRGNAAAARAEGTTEAPTEGAVDAAAAEEDEARTETETRERRRAWLWAFCLGGAPALVVLIVLLPLPRTSETVRVVGSRESEGDPAAVHDAALHGAVLHGAAVHDGSIRGGVVCLAPGGELEFVAVSKGKKSLRLFAALDRPHPGELEVEVETKRGKKLLRPRPFEKNPWHFYAAKLPPIRSGTIRAKGSPLCLTEIRLE